MVQHPFVAFDSRVPSEGWTEPHGRGIIGWQTLVSGDQTPSDGLTAGIATVEPGGFLALHRHAPAELYFVTEGVAVVTLAGVDHVVGAGGTVFIPSMCEHGMRNDGYEPCRFYYVFPTRSFGDVDYLFSDVAGSQAVPTPT